MHNTFTVEKKNTTYVVTSHNFPEISGEGKTEDEAIKAMNSKITYLKDNKPKVFQKNINTRLKSGLLCNCGVKLTELPLAVRKF